MHKQYEDMCVGSVRSMEPVFIEQIMRTAEIIRANHNNKSSAITPRRPPKSSKVTAFNSGFKHPDQILKIKDSGAEEKPAPSKSQSDQSSSTSKQPQYMQYPTFFVDEIKDSVPCIEQILHEAFTGCSQSLSYMDPPCSLHLYTAPQQLLEDVDKALAPAIIPVDPIVHSMSDMEISERTWLLSLERKVSNKGNQTEEHVQIHEFPHNAKSRRSNCSMQRYDIPYKKRALLESTSPSEDNHNISKAPVARSLNEMLQYYIERNKKLKSQTERGTIPGHHDQFKNAEAKDPPKMPINEYKPEKQSVCPPQLYTEMDEWDSDTLHQMHDSITMIENMLSSRSQNQSHEPAGHDKGDVLSTTENSIPLVAKVYCHVFTSTTVEKEMHQHIVSHIPPPAPAIRYSAN